jgi:hypothetical protein
MVDNSAWSMRGLDSPWFKYPAACCRKENVCEFRNLNHFSEIGQIFISAIDKLIAICISNLLYTHQISIQHRKNPYWVIFDHWSYITQYFRIASHLGHHGHFAYYLYIQIDKINTAIESNMA